MIAFAHIRQALALADFDSVRAQQRMAPSPRGWRQRETPPKRAAVMILIYEDADERLCTVLTLRNADLPSHSSQISFPGGQLDPGDASLWRAAQRETCEEIGVCDGISLLGQLPPLYIPASHFDVTPFVASHSCRPAFARNPSEVAAIFSLPLEVLLQPAIKSVEQRRIRGYNVRVPYYVVDQHKVWGATAMLLSELEVRLRNVLPHDIMMALE